MSYFPTRTTVQNGACQRFGCSMYSNGWQLYEVNSGVLSKISEHRAGTTTPFYAMMGNKSLPSNPFSYSKNEVKYGSGVLVYNDPNNGIMYKGALSRYYGDGVPWGMADSLEQQALVRVAKNALLLKLKDQKVNLAQAFAERAQTAELFTSVCTKVYAAFKAIKRGDLVAAESSFQHLKKMSKRRKKRLTRKAHDSSQRLADLWLELQYGWKPLLSDIFGAVETLAALEVEQPAFSAVVRKKLTTEKSGTWDTGNECTLTCNQNLVSTYVAKISCTYRVTNDLVPKSMVELGLTNPASIAWELLPWSFVIDWMCGVGDYISTWDATLGIEFIRGSITEFTLTEEDRSYSGRGKWSGGGTVISRQVTHLRTPMTGFPSSQVPAFKNPFSVAHGLNALALIRGMFK